MRVLITGGTGFIGRKLTRGALGRGWSVTLVVRRPDSPVSRQLAKEGAQLVFGDMRERPTLRAAFEVAEPDLFFHNAGWYALGIPRRLRRWMWAVNVEGLENALSAAAEYGVAKTVYTSSTTALGDTGGETVDESFSRIRPPLSYYEYTKSEAHILAQRHQAGGEPVVIACPAQAVGPGDHSPFGYFARLFVRGWLPPVIWGPGSAFTFGHVVDVAEALLLAGEHGRPGECYFVAGHVMEMRQMMKVWGQTIDRRTPFLWLPQSLAVAQAALIAPLLRLLGQPAFISPEVVRSSFVSFRYRSTRAEEELGASFRSAEDCWVQTLTEEAERINRRPAADE